MNADPAATHRLLELAEVDAELNRIAHRRRTLPEAAEVEAAERTVRMHRDAVTTVETTLSDLDRDSRRLEREIDQVRAREDRDRGLLSGGAVSPKQLTDVQHELVTLQRRQGVLEDELLEVMERREATDADAERSRAELAAADQTLADSTKRRDESLTDMEVAEQRRGGDRASLVRQLPPDLVALYEQIRARGGPGAALLRARRCGACRLELDRTAITQLRAAAPEAVMRCEECSVILVRTAESGL